MPKRRNPFGESSPLQLKQHVGTKHVDLGVCQEENMKRVYEKTKQLLFSGSKKSFSCVDKDANDNVIDKLTPSRDIPMEEEEIVADGQLHITQSGQLVNHSELKTKPKSTLAAFFNKKATSSSGSCRCCKGQAASQDRCGFCETAVCHGCIRTCEACDGQFCQLCSVMNHRGSLGVLLCVACSSHPSIVTHAGPYCFQIH